MPFWCGIRPPLDRVVSLPSIVHHLKNFENIAFAHPNRSRSVLNAYNESARYVMNLLKERTDCLLSTQSFKAPVWSQLEVSIMSLTSPFAVNYQEKTDFQLMRYGGLSKTLKDVRLYSVPNSGCKVADFDQMPSGQVALVQVPKNLSDCTPWEVAYRAEKRGAAAIFFYNRPERKQLLSNRVRSLHWYENDPLLSIPAVSVSYSVGSFFLNNIKQVRVNLETSTELIIADTFNIICDTREGDENTVVMIGAHLDSVPEGPGLVDNASGTSSILEVFLKMYEIGLNKHLVNKMRFAWWGAEEIGLMGSRAYCHMLDQNPSEKKKIVIYSNHDMLGSPNYVPFIHDGSSAPESLKTASTYLTDLYAKYFKQLSPTNKFFKNYALDNMTGGSDYFSFLEIGIPAGGLATGAGSLKSPEERHRWAGLARAAYDPCYHQPCDTVENIGTPVLEQMAKSAASVVESLGMQHDLRQVLQA